MADNRTNEEIFKDAWHAADERGDVGGRVTAGLAALAMAGRLATPERDAQVLRDAAQEWQGRLPNGTPNARVYHAHAVAQILRDRADRILLSDPS